MSVKVFAEQENSHDSVGVWDGTCLYLLHHFDDKLLEFIVKQVLWLSSTSDLCSHSPGCYMHKLDH